MKIVYASDGKYAEIIGHGCANEDEMREYVAKIGGNSLFLVDNDFDLNALTAAPKSEVIERLDRMYDNATPEQKERLLFAVGEVTKALNRGLKEIK